MSRKCYVVASNLRSVARAEGNNTQGAACKFKLDLRRIRVLLSKGETDCAKEEQKNS